jgi:hypothetical protein
MPACHYTYSVARCLFLGQTEPYFSSWNAILWLCNVLLARLSILSTALPRLSHRKHSCGITCLMLPYFFSLISYLTEGSLSYCMFDAELFFGLNMYLTGRTVVMTAAWVWHLWFLVVWPLYMYCGCFTSTCKLWGGIVGGLVAAQLEISFFQNFWAFWHPTHYSGTNCHLDTDFSCFFFSPRANAGMVPIIFLSKLHYMLPM